MKPIGNVTGINHQQHGFDGDIMMYSNQPGMPHNSNLKKIKQITILGEKITNGKNKHEKKVTIRLGIKGTVPHFQTNPAGDSVNQKPN